MSKKIDFDAIKRFRNRENIRDFHLRKLVRYDDLEKEEIEELISKAPKWEVGIAVKVGEIYRYYTKLYEVIQAHTTQGDWKPTSTPALFKVVTPKVTEGGDEIVPDFVQPTGAHDSYKKGDKVVFEGKVYESLIDNNAYSPSAYPAGWRLV